MQKIEVASAAGNIKYAVNGNTYKVSTPGSIIKITIPKDEISGVKKVNKDLMLMKADGETILLENFFGFTGKDENKLVIEDQGKLYLATYDSNDFVGMDFTPIQSLSDVTTATESGGTSEWMVPLLGVAAIAAAAGIGIAIHNNNKGGGKSSHTISSEGGSESNPESGTVTLKSAQDALDARGSDLSAAQKQLNDAVQAMKQNPDTSSVKAVNDAKASLDKAADSLKAAKDQLQTMVDNAAKNGVDTTAAEKVIKQGETNLSEATNASTSAAQNSQIAQNLLDAYPQGKITSLQDAITGAQNILDKAAKQPVDENIAAGTQSKGKAEQSLAELKTIIDNLKQSIQKAQEAGLNTSKSTELLNNLQAQYEQGSNAIAESMANALKNQQDLAMVNDAAKAAREAVDAAEKAKALAIEKLNAAQELKDQVLANNQLDKVDEVNIAIAEANKALEAARELAETANSLVNVSNEAKGKLSPEVDASLVPGAVSPVDVSDLAGIDKGLQADTHKTIMEALQEFAQKFVDSIKDVYQQILDSKPVEIIKSIIADINNYFHSIGEVIDGAASTVVESVKAAFSGIKEFFSEGYSIVKDFFGLIGSMVKDPISGTIGVIKDSISGVVSGLTKGISDALKDMTLTDWINPVKWFTVVKDVVVNSIGNIFTNLVGVFKDVPGKIIESIQDKITNLGALGDKVGTQFESAKTTISDIVKNLYDAFIKTPIENLIKPITDKIIDFISHPIASIKDFISAIVDSVKDGIDIIKNIVSLPGKWLSNAVDLVKDVIDSFKKDTVVEGNGKEVQGLDNVSMIKSLLKSADSSGDISLDKIVPQQENVSSVAHNENIVASQAETFHMPVSSEESHISAIPVAA